MTVTPDSRNPDPETEAQAASARKHAGGWGETVRTVIYAVLIALFVRTFAYEPFNIPSGSMKPTLLIGDYLFVSKFSYGYSRYSLPFGPPLFSGRIWASQPERGDVIVFKLPTDNETDYIKRLIGFPGDRIRVRDGILQINGVPVQRELVATRQEPVGVNRSVDIHEYVETLPNGRKHLIWELGDKYPFDNTQEFLVPEGKFFFMGDNRDRSQDSRAQRQVGFVPFENLVGEAKFLFFSHEDEAVWWQVWNWPWVIRWSRLGDGIE